MKLTLILFLTFVFIAYIAQASNLVIKGSVRDSETNSPILYVNVAIAGTFYGSVSNERGEFKLVVPEQYRNKSLSFSAIGYENLTIQINTITAGYVAQLTPVKYQINEIVVMPDTSLVALLRKAYRKIPENYPNYPTRNIGFYRESVKHDGGDYLYLSEAILDSYKTSYDNESDGQVKILRSRKNIIPGSDTICNSRFYGGVFAPHKSDLVKRRDELLKPSKDYSYKLDGIEQYMGREVYCISFHPVKKSTAGKIGKLYLDKESLAYIRFDYHSNEEALKWREKSEPLSALSSVDNHVTRNYENFNDRYYLKSSFHTEKVKNKRTGYMLEISDEYVTTEISIDSIKRIPDSEQVSYTTIISDLAEDYATSDWKDYTILDNESDMKALMSRQTSDSLLTISHKPSNGDKLKILLDILTRFEYDVNLVAFPVTMAKGDYMLNIYSPENNNVLSYQSASSDEKFSLQFESAIRYKLSRNIKLYFTNSSTLQTTEKSESYFGGFEYSLPLKTYGKRIYLSANAGYGWMRFFKSMGTADNNTLFTIDRKRFDSEKIEAFRGIEVYGIRLGSDLRFQLSNFWHLKLFGAWVVPTDQTDKIRLKEKDGFFLTLKSAEETLDSEGIDYFFNGEKTTSTQFMFQNYCFGLGLNYSF